MDQECQRIQLKYKANQAEGECILLEISPVKFNICKFVLFIIASVILVAIPLLIIHWFPKLKRILYYDYCQFSQATHMSIINYDDEISMCPIKKQIVYFTENHHKICNLFTNRYMNYIINDEMVVQAQLFNAKSRITNIMTLNDQGLSNEQIQQLRRCYGVGTMVIEQPTALQLFIKQMLRPLYLFLFFSVGLWFYEMYYYYAGIILFTSSVAIIVNLIQMVQLNKKIFDMAYYQVKIHAFRSGAVVEVSSLDLVPGDVVFLKKPIKIPFEGIILEGSALINECALTGQSVPVVKKADVLQNYKNPNEKIDKSAYVFQGTTIIQVNSKKKMAQFEAFRQAFGIPVCVTRTNFVTMKGQLIRIILFPKQQENVFQRESSKFLLFLFILAILTYFGMINKLSEVVAPFDIFIKFLDLIVITVPPALPVSMAFGVIYAIEKLKNKQIFCIEENKVITGGVVSFSCFDKTGTLTEDFMDFECLIPASNGKFYRTVANRPQNKQNIQKLMAKETYLFQIFNNMASNHSIIRIQETGQLIGDPMEIKLLEFGQFTLNQSNSDPQVIFSFQSNRNQTGEVFRRFDFDSDVQRMSVVCKIKHQSKQYYEAYAKGSPQIMLTILEKGSIPPNYQQTLKEYTSNGFRVLAIGSKRIQDNVVKTLSRQQIQSNLIFNGFQVFQNKLKPETKQAIKDLKQAKIGVVMITGDNPLTGSNIGFKCHIADRSKGMIICDYKDKQFCQQKFIYHERQKQEDVTTATSPKKQIKKEINQRTIDQLNIEGQNLQLPKLPYAEIVLKTNQSQEMQFHNDNKIANVLDLPPSNNTDQYMKNILDIAEQTNSQLCVTGNAFNRLFQGTIQDISSLKQRFLQCATVYARTKPNDKAKIVMVYQHTGRTVSMCGDGANDCGALKQADIGLSLSQAEASISAPFTSQVANISSMVQLIKQCRAGLATNFSLFNIMASYSLVQYTSSIICQIFYAYPGDFHYLYWDIVCNFFFIVVIGYTGTAEKLSVEKPNNSLFCLTNMIQILVAFGLQVLGQIAMILAISSIFAQQTDYYNNGGFTVNMQKYQQQQSFIKKCPETNILFLFTNFMYIFTLIAFTIGEPWKKPFFTNIPFMIVLAIALIYSIIIVIAPSARIPLFDIEYMSYDNINGFVLGVALGFGIFIFSFQKLVLQPLSLWIRMKYPQKKWL